jgi:hypothetical protein
MELCGGQSGVEADLRILLFLLLILIPQTASYPLIIPSLTHYFLDTGSIVKKLTYKSCNGYCLKVKVKVMLRLAGSRMPWCHVKSGTVTRYYFLSESWCVVSVGRPLWRGVEYVSCQSLLAALSPLPKFNVIYVVHVTCFKYMQCILDLCQHRLSTADHAKI